ncbi:hypothetical protein NT852_20790 [Bacillus amyloliquefaciens]|uniref:hypothetical protein n=1 Tax=Bacillus amyloliquefaciens TaxID=1390 RepID=UPI0021505897|nr:hypothetical protein [Bacillus amyloliquefaciens]MCR4368222.1 hypothetical protein [Bacillus amyloliquefaciens]
MNRLIAESLACIIIATLFFMCGYLFGGVRLGVFSATLSLSSSLGYCHGMRDGEKNEREKQRIKWKSVRERL